MTPHLNVRRLYDRFHDPVTWFDCGQQCAPHNPSGLPFCCDICQAVPAVYLQEWEYLQASTDLWHAWRGDECPSDPGDPEDLRTDTPDTMLLLACQGPSHCQRSFRALSCRQFPFFPYITSHGRLIGLAYEWEFEPVCWVISNLGEITERFRKEFLQVYEELLADWDDEFESYALKSEQARDYFAAQKRRVPLLHRNGGYYLISPLSERMTRVDSASFPRFGPYT